MGRDTHFGDGDILLDDIGYCSGTAVAGVGAGHWDAGWALLGMSAGALGFVRAYPALKKGLDAGDFGRVRLGAA
ncbi:hypothetical protein BN11_1850007 [Nostocoides australiense Ben110]|uniref:Uncharacterized protein n=1 Tax=Nostocoides australiense Ben110 TaxID=1193182 RepID=W6JVN7_9MICO|nr:hypothetical protein [Tetrasphaera australiensis]CCH72645.1 hypothetical protein BN11_1850007 [Tetrasphaera australiensis Ben110]